ncbi:hypothetical protein ACJJIR_06250 [Microbulbifer sp. SSSA008]|uniref:hypothetical protein n=1 Tax=Microbulbifer sp. SSSA008 TaxID=3243380 RepID=UPI00403A29F6
MSGHVIGSAVLFVALAFWSLGMSAAEKNMGPSFDCKKASTNVEKTICDNSHLSSLDRHLHDIYKGKRSIPSIRDSVKKSQIDWLRNERSRCEYIDEGISSSDISSRFFCLKKVYEKRIEDLYLLKGVSISGSKDTIVFDLIKGSQYPLCRGYVDMLNQSNYMAEPICERKIIPEFSKFSSIEWEEVKDKEEILRISKDQLEARYLWPPGRKKNVEKAWLKTKKRMTSGDWPVLYRAHIDKNHDGQKDTVYKFTFESPELAKQGLCTNFNSYFVVYDDPKEEYDAFDYRKAVSIAPISIKNELFSYDGRVFQDYWQGFSFRYHLVVGEVSPSSNQICGINIVEQGVSD